MPAEDEGPVEKLSDVAGGNGGKALAALRSKEVLIPAAVSAAGVLAASKGPDLMRKLSGEGEQEAEKFGERAADGAKKSLTEGGGAGGVVGKAVSKAMGKGGGGGGKKTRRLPIQRWTDVAVPVETAYEAWTKFDEFPKFMHRVLSVEQKGDDKISWQEKIWFSRRQWEGRVTERRENDRIAWKTTSGMSHKGVVSFHPIADRLTRVMVTMEFEPNGMMEKMASGMRFVKRAVEADLARYKAYVELGDAKGIEYRPNDADEPSSREKRDGEQQSDREKRDDDERDSEREEREKRRQERREKAGSTG
jgi:uncharacterized membrane protein